MAFPCSGCGLCCHHVDRSEVTLPLDRGDGICRYLDCVSNRCRIYTNRPLFCRIDDSFPLFAEKMTLSEFYRVNADVCNWLQNEHSAPTSMRIKLSEK
ncbi:YkgJ family cysteine cluster protein [Zoogloea oleivorans]|uniref:YkgJ family cysteine cluster protein n=1 Tax=Zoogloea oleivorans TaxID=1552750 RepID=A0A6C2CLX8_9RHOO|nr:YkgJ family cysteine cluster protein [Zoogloea oleivorans]